MDDNAKITTEMEAALQEFGAGEGLFEVRDYTDFAATIKMFLPITDDGEPDPLRPVRFVSYVDIQYRGMPRTVPFSLLADSLAQAKLMWKTSAITAANDAIVAMEKEATRLTLLNPNQAGHPPFVRTRH